MLLYLREPDRFAIWFKRLDRGLVAMSGYSGHDRAIGRDAYLDFSNHVQTFRAEYVLAAEEMDAVLAAADRATAHVAEQEEQEPPPTIPREAFEFLAELTRNNSKDWFEANRTRYEQFVRDPLS
jgi:hypothetical protein